MKKILKSFSLIMLMALVPAAVSAQQKANAPLVCRQEVFERLKPLPKLSYRCRPDSANDYDKTILKRPERLRAIGEYMTRLASFAGRSWWDTSVEEMNVCYARNGAGAFDEEEAEKFRRGDYPIDLFGNGRIRLVAASDPCYQTGFGGSNAFLLYRRGERTIVTQVLDGHFSRADNAIGLDFALLNRRQLIEVSTTTGGLNPYITNHHFFMDSATGRALPARIFKDGKGLTNRITSVLILDDGTFPEEFAEMRVIKGSRLAQRFYSYEDSGGEGSIKDASGRSLRRRVYIWNGSYYATRQR